MAQLKSTNITGNLAVTGNTLASKIIKLGGTNDDILMGDGSTTSKQALIDSLEAAMEGDTNTWREIKVNGTSILGTGIDSGSLNLKAGTNVSISNSGGTVTISSSYTNTDTGATSIEVTGTGNAVTAASYDATTRKITLTKGSTFLTSHQSLAAYVKGPASSTDNAVARFDSTTGKVIQNSRTTIDDTGNLKINNSDGGDIGLTLGRGSNADWRLFGSNGNFYIQGNYTTSKQTSFYSVLTLAYNSGNATVKGSVTADGFKHSNSTTGTNDYVLLAGGGTKSLSDFGTGSGNVSGSGLTADCIVLGNGSSSIKTSSKTITTSVGADDTTVPTSKAVKDYVTGLGYITGSYLPLAGGIMTGAIALPENKMSLKFRTHANYETGIAYGTSGNEGLTIALQNPVTAFQIVYGTKPSAYGTATWQSVTPLFQTKDGKVIINRKITATADTTNLKLLDVNGEIGATKLTTSEVITSKVTFPQESSPSIYSSGNISGVYVDHGVDTPQVRTSAILAPTTSGGTTYGVGTNGQVLKSNGTTVYWGTDNSGSGGLTSLPTRLAEYSTTGYGDANEATTQGWHYMTTTGTNRPPFKQSANKDYRIMSTAYSAAWVQQIATDFRGNDMFLRRRENSTWKPWTPIVRFQDCTADHKMQTITDNAIPRWDTGGTAMLQNSTATISDNGHLTINTTSDTTMTVPAINVLHTGPANGSSTADLMILSGYKTNPYGFVFSTHGDGTAIIQSQRIIEEGEKFDLVLNPHGGNVGIGVMAPVSKLQVAGTVTCDKITFPQESGPSIYSGGNIDGVYIEGGVETDQVRIKKIWAPTSSNGTTFGTGTNGQVLKSNGTSVYWASDSNNYAYVRQYQHGRNAAGTTSCYPLLARYNLTNKNSSYDTAYSRYHTDAFLNTISGEISTRGYNLLDSNGVSKGSIALNTSNGIIVACEGDNLVVEGSVNAYGGFYIQQPGGSHQNIATEDWVRQYVAENGGGNSGGGGGGPTDPNHHLTVWFKHESRPNYSSDWEVEEHYFANQYNEGEDNEETLYITPYSQYSENNRYVLACSCRDETPQITINHHMELESLPAGDNTQAFRVKITAPEEEMYQYWYIITIAVSGIVFTLNLTADQQYYED